MRIWVYAVLALGASSTMAMSSVPMEVEQRMVVRVRTYSTVSAVRPTTWKEHKGPKCLRVDTLGGANISQPDSIDLNLRSGQFVRARLEKGCPAHDYFYSGFYISPTADGQICVGRDVFHARIGGDCAITKFRTLRARN